MPSSEASETSSPQLQLEDEGAAAGASRSLLGIIITTAVLYLAKDILMPLAMAAILAVIFSNIASRLERFIGRFASSALVVATVVFAIVALTYFLAVQLTAVAVGVTDHSENIARKINAVQRTTPEWLAHIEYGVKNIEQQLHEAEPRPKQHTPTMVQAPTGSSTVDQVLKPVLPVLSDLTDGLLIIVLFFFLLYGREDLRYRLVRLTARIRVTLAAEAIATAGSTVSHYLLLFSLVNFGYGSSIIRYLWCMSVPMFAVFLIFSLRTHGEPNWPVTAYLSGLVLTAQWLSGVAGSASQAKRVVLRGAWHRRVSRGCARFS